MGFGEEFRKAYGQGKPYRAFDQVTRTRLAPTVPAYLLDLWESDGWASYRDGLLWFVDPRDFEPIVKAWRLPEKTMLITVARTAFGELYLLGSFTADDGTSADSVLALNPHSAEYSFVGPLLSSF